MCDRDLCPIKYPCFNIDGEKQGLYCGKHKLDGMVNVVDKRCIHDECKSTSPRFNNDGEKKGLYCEEHKLDGMVDVSRNKRCIKYECKSIKPCFNFDGEIKGLYCFIHKLDGMIDVKHKRCIHDECKKRPNYNNYCEKKALYCGKHKLDGMVNVVDKRCIHDECKITSPSFNFDGEIKGLYCFTHKLDGMVDVRHKRCIKDECKSINPSFNIDGEKQGLYCGKHKLDGMVDVRHKRCKSNWCQIRVKKKYDGYCLYCYMNLFPDKPVSRNYKTKEYSVVEFVKNTFPEMKWTADKTVSGGCSKRRPDLLLDLCNQIIIIEIDENQHTDYDCSCENKRVMELSQDVGHRPIVFIRFNPDDYKLNGKNITSCWGQNKNGICVVKKTKTKEWTQRLTTLAKHIEYWINPENTTNKTIEVIQLFYDVLAPYPQ